MMKFKFCLCRHRPPETFYKILLFIVFLKWIFLSQNCHALITIRLGAIFEQNADSKNLEISFRNAIKQANLNNTNYRINHEIRHIVSTENSYHANKAACDLIQSGVWALFSQSSKQLSWLLSSYADHFHIPYFKLSSSPSAFTSNYSFNLYPKINFLADTILSLIENENQFTFFYQNYEDLAFYKKLFEQCSTFKLVQINCKECIINKLEESKIAGENQFIVALNNELTEYLLNEALKMGMLTEYHRFVLVNLDSSLLNLSHFKNINKNITWLNLASNLNFGINQKKPLEYNLMTDAVLLFIDSIRQLNKENIFPQKISKTLCNLLNKNEDNFGSRIKWKSGERLLTKLKQIEYVGTTGLISFDTNNQRKSFDLTINRLTRKNIEKVAHWNSFNGIQFYEINSNLTGQLATKKFRIGIIESKPFIALDKELPKYWPIKKRLKGFYIDLIELLKRSIGFSSDYELYLFSKEEYFSRKYEKLNSRLIDEHIDFMIGEYTNELDQIYIDDKDDDYKLKIDKQKFKSNKNQQFIQTQPIFSMPIAALFIENSLCNSLSFLEEDKKLNSLDYLFCSNQIALNNQSTFFKVFDSKLWITLFICYLFTSLLMFFIVNFGNSFTYSLNYLNYSLEKSNSIKQNLSKNDNNIKNQKNKSNIKDNLNENRLKDNKFEIKFNRDNNKNIKENNQISTLIELSDNNHLSSSTITTHGTNVNDQLILCEQTGTSVPQLSLVDIGNTLNLYGTLNTRQISNLSTNLSSNLSTNLSSTKTLSTHQKTLFSENQLITMDNLQQQHQQNQLDVYQLGQQQEQLNEKHHSTILQTIDNNNLILHSPITIDQLNSNDIKLINETSIYLNNNQLSPYFNLDDLKNNQEKQNLLINNLLTEKFQLSNSLLIDDQLINEQSQLKNQSQYVQFQFLNNEQDNQSVIINPISSLRSSNLQSNNQQSTNEYTINSTNDLINDHLSDSIHNTKKKSIKFIIKRDNYRLNSIELSTCFWYTMALACHQKVTFKRRSFSICLLSSIWRLFTLIFISIFTANLIAYLNKSTLNSIQNNNLPLIPIILQSEIQIACSYPICNHFQSSKNNFMQQINDKLIKINSKLIEQSILTKLLFGKTIYLTNDYEARWLARKYCNLTIRKLDQNFLGLNLINSNIYNRIERDQNLNDDDLSINNKLINYQSNLGLNYFYDNENLNDNYQMKSNQHESDNKQIYEYESSDLVQYFGIIFRKQSPYFNLFEDRIMKFKENNLILSLLNKWSRLLVECDTITNSNLYPYLNDLNLHKINEQNLLDNFEFNKIDPNLKQHQNELFKQISITAKYKKSENDIKTNHLRSNSKLDKFYCDIENDQLSTRYISNKWFNSLINLIKLNNLSIKYPILNRLFYLFSLGLSISCLLVLIELFISTINNHNFKFKNKNQNKLNNKKQIDEQLTTIEDNDNLIHVNLNNLNNNLITNNNFINDNQQTNTLNRSIIRTIETNNLFNNEHFQNNNEQQLQNCDNIFIDNINDCTTVNNCLEHYEHYYPISTITTNCQINYQDEQPELNSFQTIIYDNHLESSI